MALCDQCLRALKYVDACTGSGFGKFVIAEQIEEVIALLNEAVAFLNEAMAASQERQVEIRMEFDRIMHEIDKIRLSYQN